nr:putative holin [Bordetella ansorpii]
MPLHRRLPRFTTWLAIAAFFIVIIGLVSPQQIPVVIYKISLITLAAVLAYWLDRAFFPYARPDGYLVRDWREGNCCGTHRVDYPIADGYETAFVAATIRRAIIALAVIIAVATGL